MPVSVTTEAATYAAVSLLSGAVILCLVSGPGLMIINLLKFCCRALLFITQNGLRSFFYGSEADTRRYRDPLMDIVVEGPLASLSFIRGALIVSCVTTAVTGFPSLMYLSAHWSACGSCDKPLRWWLVLNAAIQLLQLPIRLVFAHRIHYIASLGLDQMAQELNYMTSSRAWCFSKGISLANYAWYVLGIFWAFTTTACPHAPGTVYAALLTIGVSLIRLFMAFGLFYYLFAHASGGITWNRAQQQGLAGRPLPLSKKSIQSLRTCTFADAKALLLTTETTASSSSEVCSICLADYDAKDLVRSLPSCNHFFHAECIDRWLESCGSCPLCQRVIRI